MIRSFHRFLFVFIIPFYALSVRVNGAELPQFVSWYGFEPYYVSRFDFDSILGAPSLTFKSDSPFRVEYYKGASGETEYYLGEAVEYSWSVTSPHSDQSHSMSLSGFYFDETTEIWARIYNDAGFIDSPSRVIKIPDPDSVKITNWKANYENMSPGRILYIDVKLNQEIIGVNAFWYRGDSGDTSWPAKIWEGSYYDDISPLIFDYVVPVDSGKIWVRIDLGNGYYLDSPVAVIETKPIEEPRILDEPNDNRFLTTDPSLPFSKIISPSVFAIGGNLNLTWYWGESGDTSNRAMEGSSPFEPAGKQFSPWLYLSSDAKSYWVRIWNEKGSVDSRTARFYYASEDRLHFLNTPRSLRARVVDYELVDVGYEVLFFDYEKSGMFDRLELWSYNDGDSFSVALMADVVRHDILETEEVRSAPSGEYFYRAFLEDYAVDSDLFHFYNEKTDAEPLVYDRPLLYTVLPARDFSNGGTFEAHLHVEGGYILIESIRVYAGPIGDRSRMVSFNHNMGIQKYFWLRDFRVSWDHAGAEVYWFEANTFSGKKVQAILRYPSSSDGVEGSRNLTIALAPGSRYIPLPAFSQNLPEAPIWLFGEREVNGGTLSTPIDLTDFEEPIVDFSVWGDGLGLLDYVSVEVANDLAPQFMDLSNVVAVDPKSNVIWASGINGDTSRTKIYTREEGQDWDLMIDLPDLIEGGFKIPKSVVAIKTVYEMDELSNEAIYSVSRIPDDAWNNLKVMKTKEDTILTEQMGSFLNVRNYPWVQHSELGWMYLYPLAGGILFLGHIDEAGFGWNWMHSDYFPFIYNYRTGSWKYYWMNSYGWFQDYKTREWYKIGE